MKVKRRRRRKAQKSITQINENEAPKAPKRLTINAKNQNDPIEKVLTKFEHHPSVVDINKMVNIDTDFSFSKINSSDIEFELKKLKTKKASTFFNITAKQAKQVWKVIIDPLA